MVEPDRENKPAKNIKTSILAKKRGHVEDVSTEGTHNENPIDLENFGKFELDEETIKNLADYPRCGHSNYLSSYLPSPGVIFPDKFINSFNWQRESTDSLSKCRTELGNYYTTMRFLLHSRKISQLVAKTWWAYLEAFKPDNQYWGSFIDYKKWTEIENLKVLDGLIAREIFHHGGADSPDVIDNESIYLPLKPQKYPPNKKRFMILPSSKAWQGISLSLLLAGQAYYQVKEGGVDKYHQINPSILSTGEITMQYTLEVDWNRFYGDIKEIIFSNEKPWIGYHVVMPYPPIPAEAKIAEINRWAFAYDELPDSVNESDERKYFPFYKKHEGNYLMDVDYFRPPYPYIPLTCT
ncbi:MAG: hypothetical protein F6J92_27795 [Symploca sp. SIO1A3]|nr:hypothetical protein [Symploca sp. SIO1A3]